MGKTKICKKCGCEKFEDNFYWKPQYMEERMDICGECFDEQNTIETNFYDGIVINLKTEADVLNKKLSKLRENNDMTNFISTLKSLRETLDLIHKYDWHLDYSEYDTFDDNDNKVHQVSVWESNHENTIRNHKIWNINNHQKTPMYIDVFRSEGTHPIKLVIYINNETIGISNANLKISDYASIISNYVGNKNIKIYIDANGFGLGLYESLCEYKNLDIEKLTLNNTYRNF